MGLANNFQFYVEYLNKQIYCELFLPFSTGMCGIKNRQKDL